MAPQPYILARTMKDAHDFGRGNLGLAHGKYRVITHSSTIKSVRNADLYLVPGWETRHDRFAVKGAIRWTRMNVVSVADQYPNDEKTYMVALRYDALRDFARSELVGTPDGLEPPGEQLLIEPEDWEPPDSLNADQILRLAAEPNKTGAEILDRPAIFQEMSDELVDEPEEKPVNRRRRRCNDCGTLHFKTDPCPGDPFPVV